MKKLHISYQKSWKIAKIQLNLCSIGGAWFTNLKVHFMFNKDNGLWVGLSKGVPKALYAGYDSPFR